MKLDARSLAGSPVLVTGGAGFIGSHLVEALVSAGARVAVLDDLSSGRRENLAGVAARIELLTGDVRDLEACARACAGRDLVFHLAAMTSVQRSLAEPAECYAVNAQGTVNVLEAARRAKVRRVVFASSCAVYGDSSAVPAREGFEGRVLSPYAATKRASEEAAAFYGAAFGLETVALRYFNVYGERQDPAGPYAAVVPRFLAAALAGQPPVIYGDGEQTRDFLAVEDAVQANLRAAVAPATACGTVYNIGSGEETSVLELAALAARLAGGPPPVHEPARAGEVRHSCADISRATAALGYAPSVELEAGLRRCLAALRGGLRPG